jgi:hypothetical protein
MSNKRVLMITGTTDLGKGLLPGWPSAEDNYMEEVFNLTLPSKQRYCKKHGYDLLSLRSFGTDKKNRYKSDDIGALRVLRSIEMSEYYDAVMWIDADSIITNDNISINEFPLNETCCFYASWDWLGQSSMSTGNFIIAPNQHSGHFENLFHKIRPMFNSEQETINYMYRTDAQSNNIIKILDHTFLGSVSPKEICKEAWSDRPAPTHPWTKNSFLLHLTGLSNKKRIEMLNEYYREYL